MSYLGLTKRCRTGISKIANYNSSLKKAIKGLGRGQTCLIVDVSPAVKVDFEPGEFVLLVDESGPPVSLFLHQSDLDAVVPDLVGAFLCVHREVELQYEVVV